MKILTKHAQQIRHRPFSAIFCWNFLAKLEQEQNLDNQQVCFSKPNVSHLFEYTLTPLKKYIIPAVKSLFFYQLTNRSIRYMDTRINTVIVFLINLINRLEMFCQIHVAWFFSILKLKICLRFQYLCGWIGENLLCALPRTRAPLE